MKKRMISLLTIVILMLFSVTISSCEKYDYPIDNILCDYFTSGSGTTHYNYSSRVKFTIKTGKYNYAGHFRMLCNGEEIINSADYDYLVPKGKTIYSKILSPIEDIYISFELLDHNASMTYTETNLNDYSSLIFAPPTRENSLLATRYTRINYDFNIEEITLPKGNTYILFDRNNDIEYIKDIMYIKSKSTSFIVDEIASYNKDVNKKTYGYFSLYCKKECTFKKEDIDVYDDTLFCNIYLGTSGSSRKMNLDITTHSNIVLNFVNVDSYKQLWNITYKCSYIDNEHFDNSKLISNGEKIENGTQYFVLPLDPIESSTSSIIVYYNGETHRRPYNIDNMKKITFSNEYSYREYTYHFEASCL